MPMTIAIRNVPASLHRRLKTRAAPAGPSLSACLRNEPGDLAGRPTVEALRARPESLPPFEPPVAPARVICTARDRR
jgi:hypothetical protein